MTIGRFLFSVGLIYAGAFCVRGNWLLILWCTYVCVLSQLCLGITSILSFHFDNNFYCIFNFFHGSLDHLCLWIIRVSSVRSVGKGLLMVYLCLCITCVCGSPVLAYCVSSVRSVQKCCLWITCADDYLCLSLWMTLYLSLWVRLCLWITRVHGSTLHVCLDHLCLLISHALFVSSTVFMDLLTTFTECVCESLVFGSFVSMDY